MLEQLFGSRTRYKLLKLFFSHSDEKCYIREVTRATGERVNSVRRELSNLERLGIVKTDTERQGHAKTKIRGKKKISKKIRKRNVKKYYFIDTKFPLYEEMKNLFLKSQLIVKNGLLEQLEKIGTVKMLVLTGSFISDETIPTDMLVVGSLNRNKLNKVIRKLEKSLGQELRYTLMSVKEFKYRNDITDKFLYQILESKKVIVKDEFNK